MHTGVVKEGTILLAEGDAQLRLHHRAVERSERVNVTQGQSN